MFLWPEMCHGFNSHLYQLACGGVGFIVYYFTQSQSLPQPIDHIREDLLYVKRISMSEWWLGLTPAGDPWKTLWGRCQNCPQRRVKEARHLPTTWLNVALGALNAPQVENRERQAGAGGRKMLVCIELPASIRWTWGGQEDVTTGLLQGSHSTFACLGWPHLLLPLFSSLLEPSRGQGLFAFMHDLRPGSDQWAVSIHQVSKYYHPCWGSPCALYSNCSPKVRWQFSLLPLTAGRVDKEFYSVSLRSPLLALPLNAETGGPHGWDEPLLCSVPTPGKKQTFPVRTQSGRVLTLQTMALALTILKVLKARWLSSVSEDEPTHCCPDVWLVPGSPAGHSPVP